MSWVIPGGDGSEHPPATILAGQRHVTNLVNVIMKGPDWSSTAIFVSWDDDPRPNVRERARILGDLRADFDFSQPPRRPVILMPSGQLVNPPGPT